MASWLIYLAALLIAGGLARSVRLPPLVGFLGVGFLLQAVGVPQAPGLDTVAELGVTLLLFSIGLKLDPRQLLARHVWVTAGAHMGLSTALAAGAMALMGLAGVTLLSGQPASTLLLLGFALSFSSTVFAIKVLEDRSQSQSFYGRTAIGILV